MKYNIYYSELKAGITIKDSEGNELGKSKVCAYIVCDVSNIELFCMPVL